jgi:hypothetical protein
MSLSLNRQPPNRPTAQPPKRLRVVDTVGVAQEFCEPVMASLPGWDQYPLLVSGMPGFGFGLGARGGGGEGDSGDGHVDGGGDGSGSSDHGGGGAGGSAGGGEGDECAWGEGSEGGEAGNGSGGRDRSCPPYRVVPVPKTAADDPTSLSWTGMRTVAAYSAHHA